jgi:hypothetical protein
MLLAKTLRKYLRDHAGKGDVTIPPHIMEDYLNGCKEALENIFKARASSGKVRVSDLGKDKDHIAAVLRGERPEQKLDYHNHLIFWRGYVFEALTEALLELALEEPPQKQKKLLIKVDAPSGNSTEIRGTLDIIADGKVWDVKTANDRSYAEKFKSSTVLAENDGYNYLIQGQAYSEGSGYPFEGWLVINVNSCQMKDILVEDEVRPVMKRRYDDAIYTVEEILNDLS